VYTGQPAKRITDSLCVGTGVNASVVVAFLLYMIFGPW
jgi:hypothetical protein